MWGRHTVIRRPILAIGVVVILAVLSTCGWSQANNLFSLPLLPSPIAIAPTQSPAAPALSTPSISIQKPIASSTPDGIHSIWLSPSLPHALVADIPLLEGWEGASDSTRAEVRLEIGTGRIVSRYVFALVAPFPTVMDDVTTSILKKVWSGKAIGPLKGNPPLMMDGNTRDVLTAWWGAPGHSAVTTLPASQLVDAAWYARPAWAIIPFEDIEPRWKVIALDGMSPLAKQFDPSAYGLTVPISLNGKDTLAWQAQNALKLPELNRDPAKLTTLVMTGTTAMVRGTAALMVSNGVQYPAGDIASILQTADLTHISNEIAFTSKCPTPDPFSQSYFFCSDPSFIGLMEYIGTKIVELTGNHIADYGSQALLDTIAIYERHGWKYFGGGKNVEDARKPLYVVDHGNKLAFIGCNPVGPEYAWATANRPGAAPCDEELFRNDKTVNEYTSNYNFIEMQIKEIRAKGYIPIVTFQYREYEYYQPEEMQQIVFRRMAVAGAAVVSGSAAHHPQGMDFAASSFIHYGLGNLFFDQIVLGPGFQNAFIDRHVFYDGKYLGVELLPIRFEDQARPRSMTADEKKVFLSTVFCASGWTENCEGIILPPTPTAE
jgi:hypothetical protein